MTKEEHKKLGITFFNKTWEFLDKNDRTEDDNLKMLHYVHSSILHWELSGAPIINIVRGEWQVAKVYCTLLLKDSALRYAKSCFDKTIKNNIDDFDLVFAYEIMAHAYKINGMLEEMDKHLLIAYSLIDQVNKQEDKEYCISQLDLFKK